MTKMSLNMEQVQGNSEMDINQVPTKLEPTGNSEKSRDTGVVVEKPQAQLPSDSVAYGKPAGEVLIADSNQAPAHTEAEMQAPASAGKHLQDLPVESANKINTQDRDTEQKEITGDVEKGTRNGLEQPISGNSKISVEIKDKNVHADMSTSDEILPIDSVSNITARGRQKRRERKHDSKENLNFVETVAKEAKKLEEKLTGVQRTDSNVSKSKKVKKGIFISYSPDAGFEERKFVVETVRQLKENNLSDDIWFDKDEMNTHCPCWFSYRMEAVERCRAAILFLSDNFFSCPVSVYELKALLERQKQDPHSVKVFPILYQLSNETEIPKQYNQLFQGVVDLGGNNATKSPAEKSSVVIGSLMEDLEKYASLNTNSLPVQSPMEEFTGEYKKKKICQWSSTDLQEWLFKLGIKEFYRQSLAENMIDGFLLMSLTDQDMVQHLGVDSRVARKKIMQQILTTLDKEQREKDNWHLRARTQRPRANVVYLVYDPSDVRLAQNLKLDLQKKGLQVIHHTKLGQSKEEFLELNGAQIALAAHVLILLTDAATESPFVFHEILFCDWLGKKVITAMFKNVWSTLRPTLKAVLGDCGSVDFETKMYSESMDVLEHHIKPIRAMPGVVLEQTYLNKMTEGLKPLAVLATTSAFDEWLGDNEDAKIFISYQWDMQSRVETIRSILEKHGYTCWAENATMSQRGHSSMSSRSNHSVTSTESLQSQIQRNMRSATIVLSCITPKYVQSDNCLKDLTLAEIHHKPILALLMRFIPGWPPEGAPPQVRKILTRHSCIDLSNEKMYKQNIRTLIDRVQKLISH